MNEGWKCPVCGRGNAPTTKTCPCKPMDLGDPWKWEPPQPPYTVGPRDPKTFPMVRYLE